MPMSMANIRMMWNPGTELPLRTARVRRPGKLGIPMRREHRRTRISAMKAEVQSIQKESGPWKNSVPGVQAAQWH